jgi:hypothetical protein
VIPRRKLYASYSRLFKIFLNTNITHQKPNYGPTTTTTTLDHTPTLSHLQCAVSSAPSLLPPSHPLACASRSPPPPAHRCGYGRSSRAPLPRAKLAPRAAAAALPCPVRSPSSGRPPHVRQADVLFSKNNVATFCKMLTKNICRNQHF